MKLSHDLLCHIQRLELYTRRLLKSSFIGSARSKIKGTGFEFDQIRDYQMGDDVRCIDWKSSARMNKLLVKQYIEEKAQTIFIAVDVSSSTYAGSDGYDKWMTHADIAAVLALVGGYCNDMVGLILFSDTIELYIPPARGRSRAQLIIQTLFSHKHTEYKKTNINVLLSHVARVRKRNSMVLIISDFIDSAFNQSLSLVGRMYDTIAVRCLASHERSLDAHGFLAMKDIEAGGEGLIDTRASRVKQVNAFLKNRVEEQSKFFARCGVDVVDIEKGADYCSELVAFFQKRIRSR